MDRRGVERMLLLAGEPGMGKTRLLAELRLRASTRAGAIVLAGRAPDEALVPYQPLLEAIGRLRRSGLRWRTCGR